MTWAVTVRKSTKKIGSRSGTSGIASAIGGSTDIVEQLRTTFIVFAGTTGQGIGLWLPKFLRVLAVLAVSVF
jgi:putative effector of murein hydrolase